MNRNFARGSADQFGNDKPSVLGDFNDGESERVQLDEKLARTQREVTLLKRRYDELIKTNGRKTMKLSQMMADADLKSTRLQNATSEMENQRFTAKEMEVKLKETQKRLDVNEAEVQNIGDQYSAAMLSISSHIMKECRGLLDETKNARNEVHKEAMKEAELFNFPKPQMF